MQDKNKTLTIDTEFNIQIKDNFLNKKDYERVAHEAANINFNPRSLGLGDDPRHVWFTEPASQEVKDILKKNVSNYFKVEITNLRVCHYTFVFKSPTQAEVHSDFDEGNDFQVILYIQGNSSVHSGTGFYIEVPASKDKDKDFVLNNHVGFKENRIVSWTPNVYHAPLSFDDQFKPRISLIAQFTLKEKIYNAG